MGKMGHLSVIVSTVKIKKKIKTREVIYYTEWAKVGLQKKANNTVINNTRINSVSCTHNCGPTFAHPVITL